MKFNVRFLQQGTDNGCLQCDVTYKTLSPEPRQTLSGFRHQLSALEIHCESQAMAAWGTLRPWEQRGQWNPQKCPESKVQSSYPPILICIDNDIQRHYPLCPLYSFLTGYTEIHEMFWVTRFIHFFGTHIFYQAGHRFDEKCWRGTKSHLDRAASLPPELATESTSGVQCLCQHGEHIWGGDQRGGGPVGHETAQDHGHCYRYGPSTLHDKTRPYHRGDDIFWGASDRH